MFTLGSIFSFNSSLVYAATFYLGPQVGGVGAGQVSWSGGTDGGATFGATSTPAQYSASTGVTGGTGVSLTPTPIVVSDGVSQTGLSALGTPTIAAGTNPASITISADGTSVYVSNDNNTISMYSRNTSTGALTALSPATIATGVGPYAITISADGTSVYVANGNGGSISLYSRNTSTGALTALATPTIATGASPWGITISADGTSVYVANYGGNTISMYSRNTSTGALTALATPTIATGAGSYAITISADGTSVYTASYTGSTLSMYSRNTSTGALTALATPTIATGSSPWGITISPDGTSVYVANNGGNTISMYSRNTSTGALTALATPTIATGAYSRSITISADGTSVYVTNWGGATISMYSRNTSTGALTAFATPTIATGTNPWGITISADGTSVYVANYSSNTISMYSRYSGFGLGTNASTSVASSGVTLAAGSSAGTFTSRVISLGSTQNLTSIATSTGTLLPTGTGISLNVRMGDTPTLSGSWTAVGANGNLSSLGLGAHSYVQYQAVLSGAVSATTSLTALATPTIATGSGSFSITISADGTSVYVTNYSGSTISMYSRNTSTGALTALATPTIATSAPRSSTISADGTSVYVTNIGGNNTISMYSRNTSTGALTALATPTIATGATPGSITISVDGTSVYVANYYGTLSMYSRNTSTGALTALAIPTIDAGTNPYSITISADGTSVYATNYGGATISMYSRNTSTGALTALGTPTIATGVNPQGITISADGTSVYVTNYTGNTISMYSRNTSTGALTALGSPTIATGTNPNGITISADGTSVYTANSTSNNISMYSRNTSTGALTALTPPTIATGSSLYDITISPDGTSVYAVNYGSNTVSLYTRKVITTPTLGSVVIGYNQYTTTGSLTSSIFDTYDPTNVVSGVSWLGTATTSTETIKLQLRSASTTALLATAPWCGYADTGTCSGTNYFTDSSNGVTVVATNPLVTPGWYHRYFQYKATLAGSGSTPTLTKVNVQYVINAPPTVTVGAVAQLPATDPVAPGAVTIPYSVNDIDTSSDTGGTGSPNRVTPSFQYSTNSGSTWTTISTSTAMAGDINTEYTATSTPTNYTATWFATSTLSGTYNSSVLVKVIADDKQPATNQGLVTSTAFSLDYVAPVVTTTTLDASYGQMIGSTAVASTTFSVSDNSQLRYRVCNESTFSANSCAWGVLGGNMNVATTTVLIPDPTTGNEPIYIQAKDVYGNTSTIKSLTAPSVPTNFNFIDISNQNTNYYREFLSWTATSSAIFSSYDIYLATTTANANAVALSVPAGSNFTNVKHQTTSSNNYWLDDTVTQSDHTSARYYRATITDTNGNISPIANLSPSLYDVPNGTGGQVALVEPAPVITSSIASTTLANSALITFTTDKLATTTVQYGTTPSFGSTASTTAFTTSQSLSIGGLVSGQQYYFSVQAGDVAGTKNVATSTTSTGVPLTFTTTSQNTISNVLKSNITTNSFKVSWDTASSSDSYITFATTTASSLLVNPITTGSAALTLAHTVTVSGLSTGTQYLFSVKSTDALGTATTTDDNSGNFYTVTTAFDSAPVITSSIASTTLANSALITFTTDKLATSTVLYGTSLLGNCAYSSSLSTSAFTTSQRLTLASLNSSTTYYFCVQTGDVAGTVSTATSTTDTGAQLSFTTTSGPRITNVHGGGMDATTYTILWDTATSSDSYVYYATATSSGATLLNPQSTGVATSTQNGGAFTHQVVLTDLTPGVPYYYYVKSTDSNGDFAIDTNTAVYYTIPGQRDLTAPVISEISASVPLAADQAAIIWKTDKLATSQVYYGVSSGVYPNSTSLNATKSIYHVMLLASTTANQAGGTNLLSSRGIYHYIVVSTDVSGNTATSNDTTFSTSNIDNVLPVISSIVVTPKSTTATVTLTTDKVATSSMQYKLDTDPSWTTVNSPTYGVSHSITLSGLTPNKDYSYQVRASDAIGNTSGYVSGGSSIFTTTGGPIISSVDVSLATLTSTGAVVTWNTSTSSDSTVYYSQDITNPLTTNAPTLTTSHEITLSNLSPSTKYYFYVKSTDSLAESTTADNNGLYYTFTTTADVIPPVISSVSAPVTSTDTAVITWKTDKLSTSQVEFGTIASTTSGTYPFRTIINSTPSIYHIVTLSPGLSTDVPMAGSVSLQKDTTYYYRVKSVDTSPASNSAVSSENSFKTTAGDVTTTIIQSGGGTGIVSSTPERPTTPPSIVSVSTDNVGAFTVDIKVVTDKDVTLFVQYGTDTTYGSSAGDPTFGSQKSITLKNLQIGTEYHYRVVVFDKYGNTATGNDQTFKTSFISELLDGRTALEKAGDIQGKIEQLIESALPSLAPPFVTVPIVSSTTESSAVVSWKTNIKANGSVRYVSNDDYLLKQDYTTEVSAGQDIVNDTIHSVTLTGLDSNTIYHIQARSYVFPQVVGKSADIMFSTKAAPVVPHVANVGTDGFTVVWQTDEPTSSIIEYINQKTGESNRVSDATMKTTHSVQIQNLPSGTAYTINVSGVNANSNRIDATKSLFVTTSIDTIPPVITNFKVDNAFVPGREGFIQTVVGWQTDKDSNSTVFYGEGIGATGTTDKELTNKVELRDVYSTAHVMILPNLRAGTVYRIKVVSTDQSGNTKTLGPTSIITPNQTKSVLDVIVKNFEETFNFLSTKK